MPSPYSIFITLFYHKTAGLKREKCIKNADNLKITVADTKKDENYERLMSLCDVNLQTLKKLHLYYILCISKFQYYILSNTVCTNCLIRGL